MKRDVKEVICKYENAMSVRVFVTKDNSNYKVITHNTMKVVCEARTQCEIKRILEELMS